MGMIIPQQSFFRRLNSAVNKKKENSVFFKLGSFRGEDCPSRRSLIFMMRPFVCITVSLHIYIYDYNIMSISASDMPGVGEKLAGPVKTSAAPDIAVV
jgi:hypothetical protein